MAARDAVVDAIKKDVDAIADIAADLEHVDEVAATKASVDALIGLIGQVEQRIAHVDARRSSTRSETKANAIVHVLDDVQINLEMLSEQRAVIDHVAENVTRLSNMVQEAQTTARTLQAERGAPR